MSKHGALDADGTAGIAVGTSVLTPTGWTRAGAIQPGDVVVDLAGNGCLVRRVSVQGRAPVHRLRLADGGTIQAGPAQPWVVEVGKGSHRRTRTMTTLQVADAAARKVGIRLVRSRPVQMPGVESLPVPPYMLGCLLGDGAISSDRYVKLWTCEPEIMAHVQAELPEGVRLSQHPTLRPTTTGWGIVADQKAPGANVVLNGLRTLGLAGLRAYEKHVPAPYLWADQEARIAVLAGLLDTDGACDPHGQISFSSSSCALSEGVVHLVRSLGGRCSLHARTGIRYTSPTQLTPKEARDSYKVGGINIPGLNPFRLSRKAERVRVPTKEPLWTVRAVEEGIPSPLVTIEVESPTGLFLAEDFVPVTSANSTGVAAPRVLAA